MSFVFAEYRAYNRTCGAASCLGCLSLIVALAAGSWLAYSARSPIAGQTASWDVWLSRLALLTVGAFLGSSLANYVIRGLVRRRAEAEHATVSARTAYAEVHRCAYVMRAMTASAETALHRAATAYKYTQYVAFWESIEQAAEQITTAQEAQALLARNIEQYVMTLDDREHDFPLWHSDLQPLPDVEPLVQRLTSLKGSADTNINFANIGQLRDMQHALERKFDTLTAAVQHLERAVVTSMDDLTRAVNRSVLLRAADAEYLRVIVGFVFKNENPPEE